MVITERSLLTKLNSLKAVDCLGYKSNRNLPFFKIYHHDLGIKQAYEDDWRLVKEKYYSVLKKIQTLYNMSSLDDAAYYLCLKNITYEDISSMDITHKDIHNIVIMYDKYNELFKDIMLYIVKHRFLFWKNIIEEELSYRYNKEVIANNKVKYLLKKVNQDKYKLQFLFQFEDINTNEEDDDEIFIYGDKLNPAVIHLLPSLNLVKLKEYYKV